MTRMTKSIFALVVLIAMCVSFCVPTFAEAAAVASEAAVCPGKDKEHTMTNCTNVYIETVKPQCGEIGYDLYRCTTCNAPILHNIDASLDGTHKWGDWAVTVAPDCDDYGEMQRVCTNDGCSGKEVINAKNYAEKTTLYGATVTDAIKPLGHDLTNNRVDDLECKDGIPAYKEWCTREGCGYSQDIQATPGKDCVRYVEKIVKAPNCYETGLAIVKCENCSYESLEVIVNATGSLAHTWDPAKTVITTAPKCGTNGSGTIYCSVCQQTHTVVENKVTFTYVTESGAKQTVEFELDASFGFKADGKHEFTVPVTGTPADCDSTGIKDHKKCANCDAKSLDGVNVATDTELVIPATGHTWTDVPAVPHTCEEDGVLAHSKCSVCGALTLDATVAEPVIVEEKDTVDPAKHDYDLSVPVAKSEPSCTKYGFWFYGCGVCGDLAKNEGEGAANIPVPDTAPEGAEWISDGVLRLPRKAHDCTEIVAVGDCVTPTVTVRECNDCDFKETITVDAPGHQWKPYTIGATCQHDGYTFDYCTVCAFVAGANTDDGISMDECVTIRIETTVPDGVDREPTDATGKYAISKKDPDNHEWDPAQQVISTAPTCTAPGESLDYCPYCSVYENHPIDPTGHDTTKYVKTVLPTCTEDGYFVYVCSVCGEDEQHLTVAQLTDKHENYDANKLVSLATLGHELASTPYSHKDATCTANGTDTYRCVRYGQNGCKYTKKVAADDAGKPLYPKLDHKYADGSSSKYELVTLPHCAVTDTELAGVAGYVTEKCYQCSYSQKVRDIEFNWNDPKHHNGSYVNPDTVYHNGVKYDTADLADDAAKAAGLAAADGLYRKGDCDKSELIDYYCPVCKKTFFAEDASMVGTHSGTPSGYVAPGCTTTGTYAHYECSVCKDDNGNPNKILVNADGEHVIYKDDAALVIPATGHTWTAVAGTPATCLTAGEKDHYTCTCGAYSLDGKTATTETLVIDPLGHDWGELIEATAPSCGVAGELAHYECQREGCNVVSLDGKVAVDAALIVDPALTHNYVDSALVPATCVTAGYQYHYCNICGDEYVDNYVYAFGHTFKNVDKVAENCADAGTEAHVECTVCNKLFAAGTTDVFSTEYVTAASLVIEATGKHTYADGSPINNTCAPGVDFTDSATCAVCNGLIEIKHTALGKNDVDATCTEYGYTVEYCKDCQYKKVEKKAEFAPKNPDHADESKLVWVEKTPATQYTDGLKALTCPDCGYEAKTEVIEALGGIQFSYEIDNAIYSGAEYVNGGKIKLTIKYNAVDVKLASIALRLNYNADVLTFESGDFKCDAVNENGERIFEINNAAIGGATAGFVVVSAKTFGFGEPLVDETLNGTGVLAEIYFNINKDVVAGSTIGFDVATTGLSASQVLKADNTSADYVEFGSVTSETTKALGDVDIDGEYNSADEIELLDIAFSGKYVAEADVNQDGMIGTDDLGYLQDLLLGNIDYAGMCDKAQAPATAA